jgi:hypothetical protein
MPSALHPAVIASVLQYCEPLCVLRRLELVCSAWKVAARRTELWQRLVRLPAPRTCCSKPH